MIGGIVHRGSANSGHYVNLSNISNQWHLINDGHVTEISENEAAQELETNGTLIMYKKIQGNCEREKNFKKDGWETVDQKQKAERT